MTSRSDNPIFDINTDVIDTFLAITKAYLTGAERLTALNLSTAHQALEDSARFGESILAMGQGEQAAPLGPQLIEKTVAYARASSEILRRTQDEIVEVWVRQLAERPPLFAAPSGWLTPYALFTQGLEQMRTLGAAGPAATSHAKGPSTQAAVAAAKKAA